MLKNLKIMVVDDERILRVTIADDLRDAGYTVRECADAQGALIVLREFTPDVVITDIKMPGMDGIELLNKIKAYDKNITVIVMTAHSTVETAINAMKMGAYDYLSKPFLKDEILLLLERITELRGIKVENKILKAKISNKYDLTSYIGESETNKELFNLIHLVAEKDTTVLITGETGTGKEHVTNIIHYNSLCKNKPLIKVSCAILSREIFESELFGHVKGAFTGADFDKKGRFELADGGTLYLDDIDDVPLDLQVKLLRAIQENEIEKVGSSVPIKIKIRLIASTKKNLRKMVDEGKFREDLYYRLNVFPINLQPLRERKKDIRKVFEFYVNKYSEGSVQLIEDSVFEILSQYSWPGNIRELKNIAERMVIFASEKGVMNESHIPIGIKVPHSYNFQKLIGTKNLEDTLNDVEIASIKMALFRAKDNKSKAAELLGIPPSTLRSKMEKHHLG